MSVRLSECISAAPTGRIAMEFDVGGLIWKSVDVGGLTWKSVEVVGLIWKSVDKVQILLQSDKNFGHFTGRPKYGVLFWAIWRHHKTIIVQHSKFLYCWQWHVAQQYTKRCCVSIAPHCYVKRTLTVLFRIGCGAPWAWSRNSVDRQTFVLGHSRGVHLIRPFCISFLHPCVWAHRQMRGNCRKMAVFVLVQVCTGEIRRLVIQGDWLNVVSTALLYYSQDNWTDFVFFLTMKTSGRPSLDCILKQPAKYSSDG
jgi:hypothetical protein